MKLFQFLFFAIFMAFSQFAGAQIGISASYVSTDTPELNDRIDEFTEVQTDKFYNGGYQIGINYWIKYLKNYRLEGLPEINLTSLSSQVSATTKLTQTYISLQLNTHIYPLDIEGDCNCPTFSKDGNTVKKGFFINLAPGVSYLSSTTDRSAIDAGKNTGNSTLPFIAAGVGVDFGISDFITISPIVNYKKYFGQTTSYFAQINSVVLPIESSISQWNAGLRIIFRLDEINKYR